MAEKKSGKENNQISADAVMLIAVAALVFIGAFYYFSTQLRESDVKGLKFYSKGDPYLEMSSILSDKEVIIKAYAYPGINAKNGFVNLLTSEIAGALGAMNKTVNAYAFVPQETNESERLIGCTNMTGFCSNEKIIVQLDPCNCVKIQNGKINVLYTEEKINQTELRLALRGVFGGAAIPIKEAN